MPIRYSNCVHHVLVYAAGIMGAMNARPNAVQQVIQAFRYALARQGWKGAANAANGKTEL